MDHAASAYDPRYLAGILLFNERDYFEAHEVWEDLWGESTPPVRRFYQALIQAAVGLLHFGNGNFRGAIKLYRSSRAYMEPYASPYLGLDVLAFWREMDVCFAPILITETPARDVRPNPALMPTITLNPPPERWPDAAEFAHEE